MVVERIASSCQDAFFVSFRFRFVSFFFASVLLLNTIRAAANQPDWRPSRQLIVVVVVAGQSESPKRFVPTLTLTRWAARVQNVNDRIGEIPLFPRTAGYSCCCVSVSQREQNRQQQ